MSQAPPLNPALQRLFMQGVGHLEARQGGQAESLYRRIAAERPDVAEVQHNLGCALQLQKRLEDAVAAFHTALELRPKFPEVLNSLGDALRELKRPKEAIEAFQRAIALRPTFPQAYNNLGIALSGIKESTKAVEAFRKAVSLWPNFAEAWNNLSNELCETDRREEAIVALRRAVTLRPDLRDAWDNLGTALREMDRPGEAIEAYRKALALRGDFVTVLNNLVGVLIDVGQLDEALACSDQAIALRPDEHMIHSCRLCTLHYHPRYDAAAIYREAKNWNDRFARPLAREVPVHDNEPSPQRRLRIGYVSRDFQNHCAADFLAPLLAHHEHHGFEIVCYSGVIKPDAVTRRLQGHADLWRDIARLPDDEAARLIRQDKIDILVDLSLHTFGNRLRVFARKPAPIQVTWLGYPGTTGLDTIDYRLTDPRLDPPAPAQSNASGAAETDHRVGIKEEIYSERSVHLPDCFWCYDPHGVEEVEGTVFPEPGSLPALAAGRVTFGCMNNFCKVSDATLELWGKVLAQVPGSQLLVMAAPGPHRERVIKKLSLPERERGRVQFVGHQSLMKYLETFRRIDISLDPLPCGGGTTSLDSLWMGVPVVTLVGHTVVGRAGLSLLHNLDLTELVAWSEEEFVQKAVGLAQNVGWLGQLRATLRGRMEQSPLMDAQRFARNIEAAYRQMWQAWVAGRSA